MSADPHRSRSDAESPTADPAPGAAPDPEPPPSFPELLQSVAAALFGVQSEAARRRDFSRGRPLHYVIIGLAATVIFVLAIVAVVRLVLHFAGAA